jgi:hypothetical protein
MEYRVRNSTFEGGVISINRYTSPTPVMLRDCAISRTGFPVADQYSGNTNLSDYSYNAFLGGSQRTVPTNATDLVVAGSAGWQSGWLGRYYLPTNSPLVDAGSLTNAAQLGLYHHTSHTNQTREATSRLNIGAHYLATDGSGLPLDTDADGLPDYREDANGDGAFGAGDQGDWQAADPDGDGVADWVEIAQGRNPNVAGARDGSSAIGLKIYTPFK